MFSHGGMVEEVATFSDSKRAGCKETPKIIKRRRDTARQTHTQSIHAQATYHCKKQRRSMNCMLQHWERVSKKRVVSLLKDVAHEMKPVLAINVKATEHIVHKQGIGGLKHIDVAYLWMQDEVRSTSFECAESVRKTRPIW